MKPLVFVVIKCIALESVPVWTSLDRRLIGTKKHLQASTELLKTYV